MSRNKIFRCAYFSMHFRIKFLLFNDFPSYDDFCLNKNVTMSVVLLVPFTLLRKY